MGGLRNMVASAAVVAVTLGAAAGIVSAQSAVVPGGVVSLRLQGVMQGLQVVWSHARHIQRMDAQRVHILMPLCPGRDRGPVGPLDCRKHTGHHPQLSRALALRLAIRLKLGGVQVAMGVDPLELGHACVNRP